jgi:hypothetical protein
MNAMNAEYFIRSAIEPLIIATVMMAKSFGK